MFARVASAIIVPAMNAVGRNGMFLLIKILDLSRLMGISLIVH